MRSDDCREDGITHIPGKAFHLFHPMHEAFCPQYPCTAAWIIWLTSLCVKARLRVLLSQPTGFLLVTFMGKQHIYLPSFCLFHVADSNPGLAFLLQNRVWGSYSGVLMPTQCVSDDLAHSLAAERMKVNIGCHDWSIPNICSCEEVRNWPTVHHIIFYVRHEVHLLLHLGLMQIKLMLINISEINNMSEIVLHTCIYLTVIHSLDLVNYMFLKLFRNISISQSSSTTYLLLGSL